MAFVKPYQREQIIIFNGHEYPASKITDLDAAMHRIVAKERAKSPRRRSRSKGARQDRVSHSNEAGTSKKTVRGRSRQRKH